MITFLRFLRRLPAANAIIRRLLRGLLRASSTISRKLVVRWPVSGIVPVHIGSRRFLLYSEADDGVASLLYYGQEWERKELLVWEILCSLSNLIVDVGAYNGAYSLVAAATSPSATVLAFEPHPANAARLRANLALNGITNVRIEQQALGSVSGTVSMTIPADGRMTDMASLTRGFARALHADRCHEIQVRQTTLDSIVKSGDLRRLDALKIDVEYHELECLTGGSRSLKKMSPVILCEVSSLQALISLSLSLRSVVKNDRVMKIDKFVSSLGYDKFCFGDQGLVRIRSLLEHPDERNFHFVRHSLSKEFIPYEPKELSLFFLKAYAKRDRGP